MKEIEATRGEMVAIAQRKRDPSIYCGRVHVFLPSAEKQVSNITPMNLSRTNVSFADPGSTSRQPEKQPMDFPAGGIANPIGPPPRYEQHHVEPRVTDVQLRLENRIKELKANALEFPMCRLLPKEITLRVLRILHSLNQSV